MDVLCGFLIYLGLIDFWFGWGNGLEGVGDVDGVELLVF